MKKVFRYLTEAVFYLALFNVLFAMVAYYQNRNTPIFFSYLCLSVLIYLAYMYLQRHADKFYSDSKTKEDKKNAK